MVRELKTHITVPEPVRTGGVQALVRGLHTVVTYVNQILVYVAGAALVVAMLAVVASIALRPFRIAFVGLEEIVAWSAGIASAFAVAYTQQVRGHVALDQVVAHLPGRARSAVTGLVHLAGAALFALTTWKLVEYARTLAASGSASETLRVPFYPFVLLTAVGTALLSLTLLADCLVSWAGLESTRRN